MLYYAFIHLKTSHSTNGFWGRSVVSQTEEGGESTHATGWFYAYDPPEVWGDGSMVIGMLG